MTPSRQGEVLAELLRRGTKENVLARHTIVLKLSGDDLCLLAAILLNKPTDAFVGPKLPDCHRASVDGSGQAQGASQA